MTDPAKAARRARAHLAPGPFAVHFDVDVLGFLDVPPAENVNGPGRLPGGRFVASALVDFLIYSRGAPTAGDTDSPELDERHWTYMDGFADQMTARGPLLGPDRQSWTGSVHVVDLPNPGAALEFVKREPYNQSGAYEQHVIWRFTNILGSTMWEFTSASEEPFFFVLIRDAGIRPSTSNLPAELRDRLIVYGQLHGLDDGEPQGLVMAVQASSRDTLDTLLDDLRAQLAALGDIDVQDWEFGGRR